MRGVYRVADTISAVTAAKTLLYLTVPSNKVVEILSARITCQDEDTSEQIMAELNRIATLGTPSATSITPKPTEEGSSASGVSAFANVTSGEPTYDNESASIASGGANKLAGWEYVPLPEERATIAPGDSVGLRLIDAITNSSDLTAEIIYREIG